jgi:hypothetical protein
MVMPTSKKPDLDEATLRIARRMLSMPPKPHDEMKIGNPRASRAKSPGARNPKPQTKKPGK